MRFTGKLKEPIIDFVTHRLTILFEPNEDFLEIERQRGFKP